MRNSLKLPKAYKTKPNKAHKRKRKRLYIVKQICIVWLIDSKTQSKKTQNTPKMNTYTAYIAINSYRSSTSHGFGNTWIIYRCEPSVRSALLSKGMPVKDQCRASDRGPVFSTMGVRAATAAERREFAKVARNEPWIVEMRIIEMPDYSA